VRIFSLTITRGIDSYKDLTLRMGAAYELIGQGRTVVKATLGKYLEGVGITGNYANTKPHTAAAADDVGLRHSRSDARMDRRESKSHA